MQAPQVKVIRRRVELFSATAARHGAYLHPWHNWFLSAAHSEVDIRETLATTEIAFKAVRDAHGEG